MTYAEKLLSPKWQRKRLIIMNRDNFTCVRCGNDKDTLAVHHKEYKKGLEPWEYEDSELETLCDPCHKKEHGIVEVKTIAKTQEDFEKEQRNFIFNKPSKTPFDLKMIEIYLNGDKIREAEDDEILLELLKDNMRLQQEKREIYKQMFATY